MVTPGGLAGLCPAQPTQKGTLVLTHPAPSAGLWALHPLCPKASHVVQPSLCFLPFTCTHTLG